MKKREISRETAIVRFSNWHSDSWTIHCPATGRDSYDIYKGHNPYYRANIYIQHQPRKSVFILCHMPTFCAVLGCLVYRRSKQLNCWYHTFYIGSYCSIHIHKYRIKGVGSSYDLCNGNCQSCHIYRYIVLCLKAIIDAKANIKVA